jgi:hypothetical protein
LFVFSAALCARKSHDQYATSHTTAAERKTLAEAKKRAEAGKQQRRKFNQLSADVDALTGAESFEDAWKKVDARIVAKFDLQ